MWDFPKVLVAVAGLGMVFIGIQRKKLWEFSYGCCFVAYATFAYLAQSNDIFRWPEFACLIGMVALVIRKFLQKGRSA